MMGIVLMYFSIEISENVILDLRHLVLIIAALFGGPVSAMVAAVCIASGRILMFGVNEAALLVAALFLILGAVYSWITRLRFSNYVKGFLMNVVTLPLIFLTIQHLVDMKQGFVSTMYLTLLSIPVGFLTVALSLYLHRYNELVKMYKQQANVDFLTELNNVRKFDDEMNLYKKYKLPKGERLSILLIDIDHFKQVNDTYGHEAGDAVLRQLGQLLKENSRKEDIVSRNGGEEFSVLLHRCPLDLVQDIAERVRKAVESHPFELPDGRLIHMTISIGIASYPDTVQHIDSLYKEADEGLYQAKHHGRNRVCMN